MCDVMPCRTGLRANNQGQLVTAHFNPLYLGSTPHPARVANEGL